MNQHQASPLEFAWFALALAALALWLVRTHAGRQAFQHAPHRPHQLGIPHLLGVLFLYVAIQSLRQALLPIDPHAPWPSWNQAMFALVVSQFILAGVAMIIACRRFATGPRGLGLLPPRPFATAPLALLYFLVAAGLTLLTLTLTIWVSQALDYQQVQQHVLLKRLAQDPPTISIVLMAVSAIVGAALSEELLFRGIVQNALIALFAYQHHPTATPTPADLAKPTTSADSAISNDRRTPITPDTILPAAALPAPPVLARWTGIILTALIFALCHADWQQMPALVVLAICLGYAYERHGNLLLPLLIHALFNAVMVTFTLLQSTSPTP